ncbi:MAG: type IX secretion system outer membrane channel protein PorV [Balneolales bacterium]|nr:type IX secretion system outer membrane channel protein PorV [Balneolales bacterium]
MKQLTKSLFTVTALTLLFAGQALGQVGITAVPFMQIEPDSRTPGMGNAGVAIADNASAVFWNPAGLAFQEKETQMSFTYANWLPAFDTDLFYIYNVGKTYIEGIGTIGGHITYLNLGEQIQTDERGNVIRDFSSYELAAGVSYGFRITDNFAAGLGARFIYSRLTPNIDVGGQTAKAGTSFGMDLGALYRTNEFMLLDRTARFSAGFNLSNVGPPIQYTDDAQSDPLPTLLRVGIAQDIALDEEGFNTLTFAFDVSKIMARNDTSGRAMAVGEALFRSWDTYTRFDGQQFVDVPLVEQFMYAVGVEYWYNKMFAIRTGYFYEAPNNGDRQFITFGAGLRYNMFGVDFSYLYTLREDHPLANTIRLSVLLNF